MLSSKLKDFGVLKIDRNTVKVFESNSVYSNLSIGKEVDDARWTGDTITVWLTNGEIRKYTSLSQYNLVR